MSCRWAFHQGGAYNISDLAPITYRPFVAADLSSIRDIDRSERTASATSSTERQLEERRGDFDSANWLTEGDGEHSHAAQQAHVEELLASGAVALGAFDGDRLAGIGVLVPHLRPGIAQLAYLHVSNGYRAAGIGKWLSETSIASRWKAVTPRSSSPPHRPRTPCASTWPAGTSRWPSLFRNSSSWSPKTSTYTRKREVAEGRSYCSDEPPARR